MHVLAPNNVVAKYPYSPSQLAADNPSTSFPWPMPQHILEENNVFEVSPTERPSYSELTHKLIELDPVFVDGQWSQLWSVEVLSAEEQQAAMAALQQEIIAQTQERLDAFARTRGYDGILSACSYATSTVPRFQTEGQYCVQARDESWDALYTLMGEVMSGQRPAPSGFMDIEPLLPSLEWPA